MKSGSSAVSAVNRGRCLSDMKIDNVPTGEKGRFDRRRVVTGSGKSVNRKSPFEAAQGEKYGKLR